MTTTLNLAFLCLSLTRSTIMIHLDFPCCAFPNMSWFIKSFIQSTTDDIELRMCTDERYNDESTSVDVLELYFR